MVRWGQDTVLKEGICVRIKEPHSMRAEEKCMQPHQCIMECFSKVSSFIKKKALLGRYPSSLGMLVPLRDWLDAGPHLTCSLSSLRPEAPALTGPVLQKDPHDSIRLPRWLKNLPANSRATGDAGSVPGLGRSPGEGNGNPLQYCCLENPTDRAAWWARLSTRSTQHDYIRAPSLLWDSPLIPKSAS